MIIGTSFSFLAEDEGLVGLVENVLAEKGEIIVPLGGVMSISVHVPNMRDPILFQVLMNGLANAHQPIPVAAGKPDQFQLLRNR